MLFDEKGYAFTPLTLLLFIPIVILAISYGNIVSEANMLANIATGGDVTYAVSKDVIHNIELASKDAGRNAAYLATRHVIDNYTNRSAGSSFFGAGKSKLFVREKIVEGMNNHLINSTGKMAEGTGRTVYINDKILDVNSTHTIKESDVSIVQRDPYGFYVIVKEGIPVKVVQEGQMYVGKTPEIETYVSIEGLEDPYVWIGTKTRKTSNVINAYPYYSNASGESYFFDNEVDGTNLHLNNLWYCLNGTDNPGEITPRPYYVPDTRGLSFFERLENGSNVDPPSSKLSSFILGNPLQEDYQNKPTSSVDWEYINKVPGEAISIDGNELRDPEGTIFYLSKSSLTKFKLQTDYSS